MAKKSHSNNPPPVTDLSERAVKLARIIDRLDEGTYHLVLIKTGKGDGWFVTVDETNQVRYEFL